MDEQQRAMNRRRFIAGLSAAGVGSALMPGALAAVAQDADEITVEMVDAAQHIAGLRFTSDELQVIAARLNRPDADASAYETLRAASLGNDTQPALVFNPIPPGMTLPADRRPMRRQQVTLSMPATDADLAFLPVTHLARLVETRQVKPSELTELYLARGVDRSVLVGRRAPGRLRSPHGQQVLGAPGNPVQRPPIRAGGNLLVGPVWPADGPAPL